MTNPLLTDSAIPAYDRIKTDDFLPALNTRLDEARQQLASLRTATATPNLANTVLVLEDLFEASGAVMTTLNTFHLSVNDDALRAIHQTASELYDDFSKEVFQDAVLATRIKTLYDNRAAHNLDEEDQRLLLGYYKHFEASGAFLPDAAQQQIRTIDRALIGLSAQFLNNLSKGAEQQAVLFTDPAELNGVPADLLAEMAENARKAGRNGWLYKPERLQVDGLLCVAESSAFRRKIFTALNNIGTQSPYDSRPIIAEMQKLRQERTALLGDHDNYADWALDDTMAGSLKRAEDVLRDCAQKILPAFEADIAAIAAFAAQNGGPAKLEPWDSPYWAARYKKDMFAFDADELSNYLELEPVMDGLFTHFEKLFDVQFAENKTYPVFHPDIKTYDVTDKKTGSPVGILYADFFARPGSKEGGAWMEHLQHADPANGKPNIVSINMNYTKPTNGAPTLLDIGAVETLYHEAGHAFHGLLGTHTKYKSAQGPGISSDFLEIHSMAQENWAMARAVLQSYGKHHKTGASVPDALVDAKEKSSTFFATREMLVVIQNALRDLEFHKRAPQNYGSNKAVEQAAALQSPAADHIRPYPLTRFGHLFSSPVGGYAAGYYGYFWANLQSAAVFDHFSTKGLYDPATASRLKTFYQEGARRDPNRIFETFNGGPANADALLRVAGITPGKKPDAGPKGPAHPAP
ncbi:MAG: hypothetical protein KJ667_04130 [Alphaproteobacteria bacterium]|nr:hypothetical protein [Alphaproteobacteria bacterium]